MLIILGIPVYFNSYEMKNSPVGGGAYAFVDLFGFALEGDFDIAVGEYEFDFGNEYITLDPVQFAWGRFSYATTLKKNIMDISILLAKAAINQEEVLEGIFRLQEQVLIWSKSFSEII